MKGMVMSTKSNGLAGEMGGLIKIETITPAMARELLKRPSKNRPLRKKKIELYASAMKADDWQLNGETIKIDVKGTVADGQHRLEACVLSNTSFQTIVVYDLPMSVFKTIDNGQPRTLGDLLHLRNVTDGKTVASAAAYVWQWENAPETRKLVPRRWSDKQRPNRNQLFDWIEKKTDMNLWPDSVRAAYKMRGICTRSIACAAHYIMSNASRAKADEFFTKFATGAGLTSSGDPVLVLRSRFIRDKSKKDPAPAQEKFLWVMKAWSAFLEGREIRSLRIQTKGNVETFGSLRRTAGGKDEHSGH